LKGPVQSEVTRVIDYAEIDGISMTNEKWQKRNGKSILCE
jgi:hypothetical protein